MGRGGRVGRDPWHPREGRVNPGPRHRDIEPHALDVHARIQEILGMLRRVRAELGA